MRRLAIAAIMIGASSISLDAHACFCKTIGGKVGSIVYEPDEATATRVQIFGSFAFLPTEIKYPWTPSYQGYFYLECAPGSETACRAEWKDIDAYNALHGCVGFGPANFQAPAEACPRVPRLRPTSEAPSAPDRYAFAYFGIASPPLLDCSKLDGSPPVEATFAPPSIPCDGGFDAEDASESGTADAGTDTPEDRAKIGDASASGGGCHCTLERTGRAGSTLPLLLALAALSRRALSSRR